MAGPLIAAAIGIGAAAVGNVLGNVTQQGIQQFINPLLLPARYAANFGVKSLAPDMAAILPAYQMGLFNDDSFERLLGVNNIPFRDLEGNEWNKAYAKSWKKVVSASLPKMSLAELYYLMYSQQVPKETILELVKNYKFHDGHAEHVNKLFLPKFDQGVIFTNYFRGFTSEPQTVKYVQRMYGCNETDAQKIVNSSQFVPPPTDVLRFVVKDVYDPVQIDKLGLDAEYDTVASAIPWARSAGISKDTTIKYNGETITRDILRDYWISHWQLMSPTQGYIAMQRLRPNRLFRYNAQIPGLKKFDFDELSALLKSNDYVPEQRKWLAATSFNQIGRIDLRRLFESDAIDKEELKQRYMDAGYAEIDADILAKYSDDDKKKKKKEKEDKDAIKNYGKFASETYTAYLVGAISKQVAYNALAMRGFDPDLITANLEAIDLKINRERVQQLVKMIKDEFFLGLYTGREAYEQLYQGGLQQERASQYVIRWQRQLSRPRRMAGVNTLLDWVKRGVMNFTEASSRISKLGFSDGDTLLYLEGTKQDIEKRIQLEQVNKARTDKQQQKEVEQMFRQMQANARQQQAQLRTYSSPTIMKRWIKQGTITWDKVAERLEFLGVPPDDIKRYKAEMMPDEE